MYGQAIKRVVIAGGGTAGWCAAAALSKLLGKLINVTLIESEAIGIVGVGEATIPTIQTFHKYIGVSEKQFLRETKGAIKLGIAFDNWARKGDHYFHSFGKLGMGKTTWMAPFHHIWMQAHAEGLAGPLEDYCLELQAGEAGKFETSDTPVLNYAYHFDTGNYGPFLRRFCGEDVRRVEGKIVKVNQNPESGFITSVAMESGEVIEGDLFIDCTGFRGLLIEQTLKTGYEDWDHWLANDRAWATQADNVGYAQPYTSAIAHDAGWRWRIPLQHRSGNGYVFSSAHLSEDEALSRFLAEIDGPPLIEPHLIKFRTGKRLKVWNKNVVCFGLSSGFIEPLESTNIHLMQAGVIRLVQLFPFSGITEALVQHFNSRTEDEVALIRDFVIMHYKLTERNDTSYWRDRRDMAEPESLRARLAMFREQAYAYQAPDEVFRVDSWVQVMLGQRWTPQGYHHLGRLMDRDQMQRSLEAIRANVKRLVAAMPEHEPFIRQYVAE